MSVKEKEKYNATQKYFVVFPFFLVVLVVLYLGHLSADAQAGLSQQVAT